MFDDSIVVVDKNDEILLEIPGWRLIRNITLMNPPEGSTYVSHVKCKESNFAYLGTSPWYTYRFGMCHKCDDPVPAEMVAVFTLVNFDYISLYGKRES